VLTAAAALKAEFHRNSVCLGRLSQILDMVILLADFPPVSGKNNLLQYIRVINTSFYDK
jgi:hypothetical protein